MEFFSGNWLSYSPFLDVNLWLDFLAFLGCQESYYGGVKCMSRWFINRSELWLELFSRDIYKHVRSDLSFKKQNRGLINITSWLRDYFAIAFNTYFALCRKMSPDVVGYELLQASIIVHCSQRDKMFRVVSHLGSLAAAHFSVRQDK